MADRSTMTALLAMTGVMSGFSAPASAKAVWPSGTFVYADLCTEAESGTLVGHRITLKRSPNGDALTYEAAPSSAPVKAGSISLDDATKSLVFLVGTESGDLAFHGTLATDALVGIVDDGTGSHPVRLPRVLRSHANEACRAEMTGSIAPAR